MSVRPVGFQSDGGVDVVHDGTGHAGTVALAALAFNAGYSEMSLACPGCGAVSTHPLAGSDTPGPVQTMFLRTALRRPTDAGVPVDQQTFTGTKAWLVAKIAATGGARLVRLASMATEDDPPDAGSQAPILVLLAGQSNMIAAGRWMEVPTVAADAQITPTALRFALEYPGGGVTRVASGPGLHLARGLIQAGYPRVGVVGAAMSGTSIDAWMPGGARYAEMMGAIPATGMRPAGFFYYQGENEAVTDPGGVPPSNRAQAWRAKFERLVAGVRQALGQPTLPVVYVRLAHTGDTHFVNWPVVQAQQDAVSIPNAALVDPEPATLVDSEHLSNDSCIALGAKLAAAWLALDQEAA